MLGGEQHGALVAAFRFHNGKDGIAAPCMGQLEETGGGGGRLQLLLPSRCDHQQRRASVHLGGPKVPLEMCYKVILLLPNKHKAL